MGVGESGRAGPGRVGSIPILQFILNNELALSREPTTKCRAARVQNNTEDNTKEHGEQYRGREVEEGQAEA